ncbi:hypothetical protein P389DRAFT_169750 [Cystobasidium minutum MCA 4210]|uniref:uncharacterized protein n=1 Tax=Cystobasidium minutum MCA 4210 TaxID=1397322 RepID=UPI0034CECAAA|eukprot:jgi/Rhomi1/169750/fgenesh1_kg.3_\
MVIFESLEHALLLFSPSVGGQSSAPGTPSSSKVDALIDSLIVKSDYIGILKAYRSYFHFSLESGVSITFDEEAAKEPLKQVELLICGIAALEAFLQANWTGPAIELDPKNLFVSSPADENVASTSTSTNETWTEEQVNAKCVEDLSMSGEPACHLAKMAGYLLLAKKIFYSTSLSSAVLSSLPVWQFRLGLVNIRLLDTAVALPAELLSSVISYTSSLPQNTSSLIDLKASLLLLQGLYHSQFVHISSSATKISNEYFYNAAKVAGLKYELTGRMGKRTKWQIDERSQLVVLAKSREDRDDGWTPREKMSLETTVPGTTSSKQEDGSVLAESMIVPNGQDGRADQPKGVLLNDDTLLERTHFTSTASDEASSGGDNALASIDPNNQPVLHPLDECILLALSLVITNTSPSHGLTTLQIQSFVTRVLEDGSQNWSVYSMALLLRSRLEANRSRTVERGLLQIQSLVDQLKLESVTKQKNPEAYELDLEKGASPYERLKYFHQLNLPSTWELEKELATRYLGLGVVRSAMEIFTRLEMWEDVAKCHSAVGDDKKAIQIVRDLLDEKILESESTMSTRRTKGHDGEDVKPAALSRGQKVKLWCLLGDLERDLSHYQTAWQVSEGTSSRAMQSLGKTYFTAGDFPKAQERLEKALAINPLNGKLWFILGCAAMRNEDWKEAETSFRRCTSIDDDDGEAWNNLATVLLKQVDDLSSPAYAASQSNGEEQVEETLEDRRAKAYDNKKLAFTCLRQAIRYAYDSWRIWVNYMLVSVDVGELSETCRAMGRLAEMRADKDGTNAIDLDVLDKLVSVVVKDAASAKMGEKPIAHDPEEIEQHRGLAGRVKDLFEHSLLPRIAGSSHIYTSYARLLFALNDLKGSLEAHMKAYRVDVVQNDAVATSKPEFEKAATRVSETVDIMRNLGDMKGPDGQTLLNSWRLQARNLVRTFLGRTKEAFGEEPSWERLQQELQELKA